MNWISLALVLLRIADNIFSWVRARQEIDAGVDQEIAKASASILSKTQSAKKVMEEISGLSETDVDKVLRGLEEQN